MSSRLGPVPRQPGQRDCASIRRSPPPSPPFDGDDAEPVRGERTAAHALVAMRTKRRGAFVDELGRVDELFAALIRRPVRTVWRPDRAVRGGRQGTLAGRSRAGAAASCGGHRRAWRPRGPMSVTGPSGVVRPTALPPARHRGRSPTARGCGWRIASARSGCPARSLALGQPRPVRPAPRGTPAARRPGSAGLGTTLSARGREHAADPPDPQHQSTPRSCGSRTRCAPGEQAVLLVVTQHPPRWLGTGTEIADLHGPPPTRTVLTLTSTQGSTVPP